MATKKRRPGDARRPAASGSPASSRSKMPAAGQPKGEIPPGLGAPGPEPRDEAIHRRALTLWNAGPPTRRG